MAKNRYGKSKGKAARKKGGRKDPKRVAAGKRAWAKKVKRYGSKKAALAATFGSKRAAKKGGRKGSKNHRSSGKRSVSEIKRLLEETLEEIQVRNGTFGMRPTEDERAQAYFVVEEMGKRPSVASDAEKLRVKIAEEKRKLAKKLAAEKLRQKHKADREREERDAEAQAEAELRSL